jgi:oligopeptide/dipeptide ABC transporter ATP-binding protein
MRQRVMIAMALACRPSLLIADEPTTALDVTVQMQILDLLRRAQSDLGMGVLFITHNLALVAAIADRVAVMYAGRVVETAPVRTLFSRPRHPYTQGLLASRPERRGAGPKRRLRAISGSPPDPREPEVGCAFAPRCPLAIEPCRREPPPLEAVGTDGASRCLRWGEL